MHWVGKCPMLSQERWQPGRDLDLGFLMKRCAGRNCPVSLRLRDQRDQTGVEIRLQTRQNCTSFPRFTSTSGLPAQNALPPVARSGECRRGYVGRWIRGQVDTWTRGYVGTWIRGHVDTWTRGYVDSHVDTWTRGYVDTWIRGCVDAYVDTWTRGCLRGHVDTWIRGYVLELVPNLRLTYRGRYQESSTLTWSAPAPHSLSLTHCWRRQ